jgi:hypothetical protein
LSWVLRTTGNFPKCTPVRDLHAAFNLPYVYDYTTKSCRQQPKAIQNHENEHVRSTGQGEARHRKQKRLKLGSVQATRLLLYNKISMIGMICSAKPGLTEGSYIVQREEFSITCYMCNMYT